MSEPSRLRWRHTWPSGGPDFALERGRDDRAPEIIGRVRHETMAWGRRVWTWSLTCGVRPVGVPTPVTATHGVEDEKQAACDALKAAWAKEEAFRAELRALIEAEPRAWSLQMREHVLHGQPEPPWQRCNLPGESRG